MLLFYKHFYNILFYCLSSKTWSRWLLYEFFVLENPFHSFSPGSIFTVGVGFFFPFWIFFFPLSDHILQRQSILYLRFTGQKSIATTENNSHFCFHNTSQPYSFCLGAHECGERRWRKEAVGSGVGLALVSHPGTSSVVKVIRLPFWLWSPHHDGKNTIEPRGFPAPHADIPHTHLGSGWGSHALHLGIRRQAKEFSRLLGDPRLTALPKAGLSSLGSSSCKDIYLPLLPWHSHPQVTVITEVFVGLNLQLAVLWGFLPPLVSHGAAGAVQGQVLC